MLVTFQRKFLVTNYTPTFQTLTATKVTWAGAGTYSFREESEPLGQKIQVNDPGSATPTSYEMIIDSAQDPEWHCQLPQNVGNFRNMPVNCKKAAINRKDFSIPQSLGFAMKGMKDSNPTNTNETPPGPSPRLLASSGFSPGENTLAYASLATNKPSKDAATTDDDPDKPFIGTFNVDVNGADEPRDLLEHIDATVTIETSDACDRALAAVDKDRGALSRALQNRNVLEQVDKKHGIHASALAAIGVRESGFQPAKEDGNSKGIGIFQIDMRYHSKNLSADDAMDFYISADYMGKILRNWYDEHVTAMKNVGYPLTGENSLVAIAAAVHSYNSGKVYSRDYDKNNKGQFIYKLDKRFKDALDGKKVSPLDRGTTHSNYVSSVWDIAIDCFGFNKR